MNGAAETAGILLDGTQNVTVRGGGTVTGFDAGIVIDGGSGNTVRSITARDNINDNIKSGKAENNCLYGDGITTTDSDANTITDNRVVHNGPYSGISLVGDSDANTVSANNVQASNVANLSPTGDTGTCGAPFSRPYQDIGIRIEGPGATDNVVRSNRVTDSGIGGITIHGHVYNPPGGGTPDEMNTGNLIQFNYVADTGRDTYTQDALADGIGVLRQGPGGIVGVAQGNTIDQNVVVRSYRHGVFLGNPACGTVNGATVCQPLPYSGNTVTGNDVRDSLLDGIRVQAGSVNNTLISNSANSNGEHDGHDANANCDNNVWSNNVFAWVNQACVSPAAGIR